MVVLRTGGPVAASFTVEWVGLALLVILKLALLGLFGPTWEPDWGGYSDFANIILSGTQWLHDAGLDKTLDPVTIFRSVGYPLVVALFRGLLGPGPAHHYAIVLFQFAFSIAATMLSWRLAWTLLRCRWAALAVAAGHATALTLLYDQSLLSDSLYNSLFVICWSAPLIAFLERRAVRFDILALLGLLYGYSCLQRGTGLLFLALVLPMVIAWAWRGAQGARRIVALAAFLAPVALLVGGNMAWNLHRTGVPVMTTGAQFVMIQPMVKAAARGHQVFDGDTPIDALAAKHLKTYEYNEVGLIAIGLFQDYGLDAIRSAELHKKVFVRAWLHHPWAMTENMLNNFNNSIIFQFFDPIDSASFYARLITGERLFPGFKPAWKEVRGGNVLALLGIVAVIVFRTAAYASALCLILGGPVLGLRAIRRRSLTPEEGVALGLWALFLGYILTLCAIHMVGRFVPAVLPAGLIGALFFAQQARAALAARKG